MSKTIIFYLTEHKFSCLQIFVVNVKWMTIMKDIKQVESWKVWNEAFIWWSLWMPEMSGKCKSIPVPFHSFTNRSKTLKNVFWAFVFFQNDGIVLDLSVCSWERTINPSGMRPALAPGSRIHWYQLLAASFNSSAPEKLRVLGFIYTSCWPNPQQNSTP